MNIIKKYKKLSIIGFVIIAFVFYQYGLKPNQEIIKNELMSARISKPKNLKDGQCVIQVLGTKGELFDKMKEKCRVLTVLDKYGSVIEIIEKDFGIK